MEETWLYRYDPETKQQSMECGMAAHPAPQNNSEYKNPLKKFSHHPIVYLPKGQTINAEYYSSLGAIEGHFEGKTLGEGHQGGLVLA